MIFFDLLLISLAALYITHVFTTKEGPFRLFVWLRDHLRQRLGGLLGCFFCLIFWSALILFGLYHLQPYGQWVVWVLAIAGAACVVRSYSGLRHD